MIMLIVLYTTVPSCYVPAEAAGRATGKEQAEVALGGKLGG